MNYLMHHFLIFRFFYAVKVIAIQSVVLECDSVLMSGLGVSAPNIIP
jgi:hypothetical protein